jgi:hypothetical protein
MKNFVSAITFFKTYIQVMYVKNCKLDEIGVKHFLEPSRTLPSPQLGRG